MFCYFIILLFFIFIKVIVFLSPAVHFCEGHKIRLLRSENQVGFPVSKSSLFVLLFKCHEAGGNHGVDPHTRYILFACNVGDLGNHRFILLFQFTLETCQLNT